LFFAWNQTSDAQGGDFPVLDSHQNSMQIPMPLLSLLAEPSLNQDVFANTLFESANEHKNSVCQKRELNYHFMEISSLKRL
jgi:hypothetical protein